MLSGRHANLCHEVQTQNILEHAVASARGPWPSTGLDVKSHWVPFPEERVRGCTLKSVEQEDGDAMAWTLIRASRRLGAGGIVPNVVEWAS